MTEEDYLAHYGVKGMKWGVRKNGRKAKLKKAKADLAKMSDKDLQNKLNRYNNEQKYLEIVGAKRKSSAFSKKMREKSVETIANNLTKPIGLATGAAAMLGYNYIRKHGMDTLKSAAFVYALNND